MKDALPQYMLNFREITEGTNAIFQASAFLYALMHKTMNIRSIVIPPCLP